ncbi:alpha/beta hydrolase [Christensenellaceae bacterium OttesenSCG-928-K19]|nr:alpha/beta hydrolase [Christensenellaceae bacterium OttesenSCG-928-K19]
MFEQIGANNFKNRQHTGAYAEIEFDTYVEFKGKEEVQSINTTVHYYEAGEGEPLILVHGIGQSTYAWRKSFEELAKNYHVFALDLPGHGFSGKPEMSYSIEEFALALEAFMNTQKIVSAYLCAFGEATGYVLDFAEHNADRAKGIILISPVVSGGGGLLKGRGAVSVFGSVASKMVVNAQAVRAALEDCYFDRTLVTDEVVEEYYGGIADKDFRIISRLCMNNYFDTEVINSLGAVRCPILVLVGGDDKITGGPNSDFLNLNLNNGSFLTIRNCGYLVQEEKSEKTLEAIRTFLKQLSE